MEDRRHRVWAALRSAGDGIGIADLSEKLGMHPNTVRFHLDSFVTEGRVERSVLRQSRPGRPSIEYRIRRAMNPNGPRNYQLLARLLATALESQPDAQNLAIQTGHSWGEHLVDRPAGRARTPRRQAVRRLITLLTDLGFQPEAEDSADVERIDLRNCPFLDLAQQHPRTICALHLGLVRGALTTLGASVQAERLEPFAEPDLCRIHLSAGRPQSESRQATAKPPRTP